MSTIYQHELEHAHGEGLLGLCIAASRYDPNRNSTFYTYAEHRIRGQIIDGYRSFYRTRTRTEANKVRELSTLAGSALSLEVLLEDDTNDAYGLQDAISDTRFEPLYQLSKVFGNNLPAETFEALATLSDRQKTVIYGRYLHGRQQKDIAKELGVTESRISQIESGIIKILRATMVAA
jgi:RNA polymerase sigma factor for flagellar operon FliA